MTVVYFTRHGESLANQQQIVAGQLDSPLTDQGRFQAKTAAEDILARQLHFDTIITSPLNRTVETAQIIARNIGVTPDSILVDNNLRERNCGGYEGGTLENYFAATEEEVRGKGVESLDELASRAALVIEHIQTSYPEKTVLIVTHSGIAKMLKIVALKQSISSLDKSEIIPNAIVTQLEFAH